MRTETLTLKFSTEAEAQAQYETLKETNQHIHFELSGNKISWQQVTLNLKMGSNNE
jgi:hypothetical protein